jgi:two-component system chemotaxis response regulator CheY
MALKLMIVGDDPVLSESARSLAEPLGCEVIVVEDAREAARRIARERFDGIVLNASRSQIDGCALAQRIRSSPANSKVPIAMLTDARGAAGFEEAFKAGATFCLERPADGKQVRSLLKAMHGAMVREKRDRVRVPVRTTVEWEVGSRHLKSTSLNVSTRGMLVELEGNIALGEEAVLRFLVRQAGQPEVRVRARVVRKEPPNRVAVQFVEPTPEVEEALRDLADAIVRG